MSKDEIVLTADMNLGTAKYTFPLSSDIVVNIHGKDAKLEDLKPGMLVQVGHRNGRKADLIIVPEPPKEAVPASKPQ